MTLTSSSSHLIQPMRHQIAYKKEPMRQETLEVIAPLVTVVEAAVAETRVVGGRLPPHNSLQAAPQNRRLGRWYLSWISHGENHY